MKLPALRAVVTGKRRRGRRLAFILLFLSSPGAPLKAGQIRSKSPWWSRDYALPQRRAHSASQWGTRGVLRVPSQAFLRLIPFLLFLQSKHLLLVAMIHRHLNWQNGVLVVAVPLHAVVINIVGVLNSDKPLILQLCDVLHYRGR